MDAINESDIRRVLKKKPSSADLLRYMVKTLLNPKKSWEEKRALWHFLYNWGKHATVAEVMVDAVKAKDKIPYDILIEMTSNAKVRPSSTPIEAVLKGIKKQEAAEDLISARGWEKWDKRFKAIRRELMKKKRGEAGQARDNMFEKFQFLLNQRLVDQAGRVLRRMLELFPNDAEVKKTKLEFDDQWARDVVATHMATLSERRLDRVPMVISPSDRTMLQCFLEEGEKIAVEHRDFASDLAVAFMVLEEYNMALEILAWAPATTANDWLKADLLINARRFVEAMEHLNHLELKFVDDPETSFAVSYLRAQCLRELAQNDAALEILQSIVRVRPNYRSAQALIQEWTEGAGWT